MKKLFVSKNYTQTSPWIEYTFEHIERFKEFEKDNYELIDNMEFNVGDEVYFVGYKTSSLVKKVVELNSAGVRATIIENLCCDDSVRKHTEALDTLFLEGIYKVRSMAYLQDEIRKVFIDTIGEVETSIDDDTIISTLNLDSLTIMHLSCNVEDLYNTELNPVGFTKFYTFKNIYKILEGGRISNKFMS